MDRDQFGRILDNILRLRAARELNFVITRSSINVNWNPGVVLQQLTSENVDTNLINQVVGLLVPIVVSICVEDESGIEARKNVAAQILQLPQSIILESAQQLITDKLRRMNRELSKIE